MRYLFCENQEKFHCSFYAYKILFFMFIEIVLSKNHQGIYSGLISQYDIVTPRRILSHGLEAEIPMHSRLKRDISGERKLLIKLHILGKEELLILWPSYNFMSNKLHVEIKKRNGSHRFQPSSVSCHYHGIIEGQPDSTVAVSLCYGLVGYMKTTNGEFWIEPTKNVTTTTNERLHLLYRRNAITQIFSKRKRKKRKKYDKLCGTREPRRIVESQLQWNQKPGRLRIQGRGQRKLHRRTKFMKNKVRTHRSVSREQHVETLVVADSSVVDFYQSEDIETYILSIMNMVSVMFQDPSIGNYINIVVVRIMILEDDESQGLNITVNADKTLDSFCRWQKSLNEPDEDHLLHHDVAILITRQDICAGADIPCSTLGVAHVAGMCQPDRSCSVNEDNGITLAHTVAHELGHNFGMYHDSVKIGCSGRDGSTLHVMTPSFEADTLHIAWSPCSRRDITHFLDGGFGTCLEDKPVVQVPLTYPELPVGVLYDAEHQCKLQFGVENSTVCIPLEEICSRLWCIVDNVCTTMLHPAAPGTRCGKHKWCDQQQCVGMKDKSKAPVNGGWGKWSEWSPCSRSCGAGVSITERFCDHPPPSNGGKYCLGQRTRYKICNTQDCPESKMTFRALQCSTYNNKTVDGKKGVTWLPYFETMEPCQLYCTDKDDTTIMPMGIPVLDGTACNLGTRDMCISGLCRRVGCDWIVDSKAVEDKCGICKGDGSQCLTINGFYNKTIGAGYIELVSVPKNARNILVEELGNSKNYLAVGSTSDEIFYLNGNKAITLPGEYNIANSQAMYTRQKEKEKLHILGPIQDDILIYLIYQGNYKNTGVRFEYTMPLMKSSGRTKYEWAFSEWTACSVTCGGGVQHASPLCRERESKIVNNSFCKTDRRPPKKMRTCNLQQCTHRWWTGPWQLCPVTCGELAIRIRTILCISNDDNQIALPDSECEDQPRPHHEEPCVNIPTCLSSMHMFTNTSYDNSTKHQQKKKLQFQANEKQQVNKWITLPWSQCSVTCGLGFKRRTVYCSKPELCSFKSKPIEMKQCFKKCSNSTR